MASELMNNNLNIYYTPELKKPKKIPRNLQFFERNFIENMSNIFYAFSYLENRQDTVIIIFLVTESVGVTIKCKIYIVNRLLISD